MTSYMKRLYAKYCRHMGNILQGSLMLEDAFTAMVSPLLAEMKVIESGSGASQGFLLCREWDDDRHHVEIPVFGYDADDRKTAVRLFQKLADETVRDQPCDFSVNLYSNDRDCIQAFSMMQFGIMSEVGVRKLEDVLPAPSAWEIRSLSKTEIRADWHRLWDATGRIIAHLRESPVFYPGCEFTEEVYRDFYMDEATELIAAYDQGKLAGIIEWNQEKNGLLSPHTPSVNVGEVYVYPHYRGTGLSRQLLRYAEKAAFDAGSQWMWVQHGTANPNACGFWNRYFQTYQFEMVRTIVILNGF